MGVELQARARKGAWKRCHLPPALLSIPSLQPLAACLFQEPASLNPPPRASYSPTTSFFTRVLGTRRAPAHRVSDITSIEFKSVDDKYNCRSLDYEPLQNKLYVHQLHERRDGRKKIYGYMCHILGYLGTARVMTPPTSSWP
eukprot:1161805-Pelagomonas_calceolata.AAC.1